MFCTLTLKTERKRFCRNLIIKERKIGNITFYEAVAYKKSAIKKLEKKLKGKADTVLLSENLKDVNFKKLKVYNNNIFLRNVSIYTFKNIIKLSKIPTNKLTICIVDKDCEYKEFVTSLSSHAAIIKIVTNKKEEYQILSDKIYEEYGMNLIISDKCDNADLGIDFDNVFPEIWFNSPNNCVILNNECVKIGVGLKKYVPQGINECDFAGVLKDYREFKRLRLLHADVLLKNKKFYKINRDNIKKFLDNKSEYW